MAKGSGSGRDNAQGKAGKGGTDKALKRGRKVGVRKDGSSDKDSNSPRGGHKQALAPVLKKQHFVKTAVALHPKREEIETAIIEGRPIKEIASGYGLTYHAVYDHMRKRMADAVAQAQKERGIESQNFIINQIDSLMEKLNMMLDACHEALLDPDDPTKYNIEPRATDIKVIYREYDESGKGHNVTRSLQEVIQALEKTGATVTSLQTKSLDPRAMLLNIADSMEKQLTLLGRMQGTLGGVIDEMVQSIVLIQVQKVVIEATKGHPEIRRKIAESIQSLEATI